MSKPLRRFLSQTFSRLPLRAVLIIPFVLLILLVAGLIGFPSFYNGQKAVKDLATQLETEIGQRIEQTLETYLKMPQLANQITADAVRQGVLDLNNLDGLQEYLWNQFRNFNSKYTQKWDLPNFDQQPDDISVLAIATEQGDFVNVGYYTTQRLLTLSILDHRIDDTLRIWQLNQWGKQNKLKAEIPDYNPHTRSWYQDAFRSGSTVWVGPYSTAQPNDDYVISADQPLYDRRGNFVGVTDATLSLLDINRFLSSIKVGNSGQVFMMQLDGDLLATSTQDTPFVDRGEGLHTIQAIESENMLIQETTQYLQQHFGSFDQIAHRLKQQPQQLEFRSSDGKKQFVRVHPFFKPQYRGIDWLVVITIPQDDFMAQIRANTIATILGSLSGLLGAIVLGIVAAHWLTKPLLQLSRAADGLAKGDWERPVTIRRSGELGILVNAFNHMRQELNRSQQQLKEYSQGLEQKNEQLETLEADLRRQLNLFLHAVSHDLRNPVLGMSMVLNNLSGQAGDDIKLTRKVLERMQESSRHQLELINSLIDSHAAEMWGISLHPQPVTLRRLVENAVADLQPMLERDQAELDNRIPADLPLVSVDPLQLGRVYQNLLANALKHNPSGLKVILKAQVEGDWIYCTVTDTGVGIPPEQCDRLFDPYFRGGGKPKSIGLGLGLYLCQQIIRAHAGQIGVESQPGAGTMFWFTLPIVKSNP